MQKVFHPKEEEERTWKAFCHKLERRRRKKGKERRLGITTSVWKLLFLKILFNICFGNFFKKNFFYLFCKVWKIVVDSLYQWR